MKKIVLISVLFFFIGSITTYTYISIFKNENVIADNNSLEGSKWMTENQLITLRFSENDNSCFMEIKDEERIITVPLSYSKVDNDVIVSFKEDLATFALIVLFETLESRTLKIKNDILIFPINSKESFKFHRL